MAVAEETIKPPAPPGAKTWLRENLFNTWYNSLLTVITIILVFWLLKMNPEVNKIIIQYVVITIEQINSADDSINRRANIYTKRTDSKRYTTARNTIFELFKR